MEEPAAILLTENQILHFGLPVVEVDGVHLRLVALDSHRLKLMEAMGETTWAGRGFQLCHSLRISRVTGVGYRLESVADGIFIVFTTVVAAGDGQDAQYEQTGDEQQYKETWHHEGPAF